MTHGVTPSLDQDEVAQDEDAEDDYDSQIDNDEIRYASTCHEIVLCNISLEMKAITNLLSTKYPPMETQKKKFQITIQT